MGIEIEEHVHRSWIGGCLHAFDWTFLETREIIEGAIAPSRRLLCLEVFLILFSGMFRKGGYNTLLIVSKLGRSESVLI